MRDLLNKEKESVGMVANNQRKKQRGRRMRRSEEKKNTFLLTSVWRKERVGWQRRSGLKQQNSDSKGILRS